MSSIELSKLRANLKLTVNRLKLLQNKNSALAKQNRRQLAQVLEDGKIESARIRIENIIQEDIYLELLESLEIYAELVQARCTMLHGPNIADARLNEAVHVLLYSSQFVSIKELTTLRPLLAHLLTKEFVQRAIEDKESIPPKILGRIHVDIPKPELVDLYMLEIAKAYNVAVPGVYEPPEEEEQPAAAAPEEPAPRAAGAEGPPEDASNEKAQQQQPPSDDLWARFAQLKK